MKVVEVETDDIGTFKSVIEILNGTVAEANADFIRDAKAFCEKLDGQENKNNQVNKKQPPIENTDTDTESNQDEESEPETKKKKAKPKAKKKTNSKNKKVESDESDDSEKDESDNESVKSKSKSKKQTKTKTKSKTDAKSNKTIKETKSKKQLKNQPEESESDDEKDEANPGQIKILTTDPNQVMIIYIVLEAESFKKFVVHPDKYSVGLNLDELSKYIKNVDKEGTMSIHIDSDDTQHVVFNVKGVESTAVESICELRVVNLPQKPDKKIEINVTALVRINCHDFHKKCKDLMQFSQFVEITCDPSQLAITCKGDMSNHQRIFKADGTQNGIMIKFLKQNKDEDVPDIIRLVFDLKYINSMYKCSALCDDMEIYLNSDSIMFLKYGIKLMGVMMVGISPSRKKREHADNYDENMDEYYRDDQEIQLIN